MKKVLLCILIIILFAALAAGAFIGYEAYTVSKAPNPAATVAEIMDKALKSELAFKAETAEGKAVKAAIMNSLSYELGEVTVDKRNAEQTVTVTILDTASLFSSLQEDAQPILKEQVEKAKLSSEVYNEDNTYKQQVLDLAALAAFNEAFAELSTQSKEIQLKLRYEDKQWNCLNTEDIYAALWPEGTDADAIAADMLKEAVANPQYVKKIYKIEETAKAGPEPDRSKFGSTTDPAVIEELIASPLAQELIKDQQLVWNKDIAFIPGTEIHYYLDETILTIVWQEVEAMAVGTFAETFIADGSQLRRKIAADTFESFEHQVATELSRQTNAVLAVGGDLYHHARNCGIVVYEREIYRFDPYTCDTCYITADGDMLFSYRGQFSDISEAEAFVKENDILYSICFGPVLIDNGVDVTPSEYPWGEINDFYARSALGLMGDKHYLTMNINCQMPDHYYLASLRQAADAMVARGCIKAYALDGGQTASTIINNQLINPVQFGWERETSDILYFATAVPN